LGTPLISNERNRTKVYSRVVSVRVGSAPNSSSFTENELFNLSNWTSGPEVQGGVIYFGTGTSAISDVDVSITNTTSGYLYIIYNSSIADLTAIYQGVLDVTTNFQKSTVGSYKVYRTILQNSPNTHNFTLNP